MISVLLVDDHDLVRMGFRLLLEQVPDIEVVGEADCGEAALEQIPKLNPDLVLMDINMPGIGGIEATRKVRHHHPQTQVIVVTAHDDSPFPFQLHEAGALGYLTKGCHADELFTAIRTVAQGQPYISSDVSQRLTVASLNGVDHNSPFTDLSQREMQILLMVVQGKKNKDISDVLNLSQKTISTYRHRLHEKLKVNNDVELALMAIRHGLVERENI